MNHPDPQLTTNIRRVFLLLSCVMAFFGLFVLMTGGREAVQCISLAVGSVCIGLIPLRFIPRLGIAHVPALWIGSMTLRMFAFLIGLVLLAVRYDVPPVMLVSVSLTTYLVLIALETVLLIRLVLFRPVDVTERLMK